MNLADLSSSENPALKAIIAERIRSQGPIGFDDFLELALYHPQHGYYFACDPTLDYQTSPNVHPVFGALLARQVADFWRLLDRPQRFEVFEAAAGSLSLASSLLRGLALEAPELYEIVRYTAQDPTLRGDAPASRIESADLDAGRLHVASGLPAGGSIDGCMLSNELLDTLPFRRVRKRGGVLYELLVGLDGDRFVDIEAEPSREVRAYFETLDLDPGEGCEAEVSLAARDWTARAAAALKRGYVLSLDYGYEAPELYAPWRRRGTLLTFYRHTSGDDPYARIGRQDITASIDFMTVQRAGEQAGLTTLGLTTQAEMLAALGAGGLLGGPPAPDQLEAYYALRRAVIELGDAAGLGRIRALFQGRGVPATLPAGLKVDARSTTSD